MNKAKQFLNENFGEVRAITKEGEIWFVAKDICDILEIKSVSLAVNGNPTRKENGVGDKNKAVYNVNTLGGNQDMLCISEQGLYKIIFKSRKPFAEEFQDWICETVIPTIRSTGGFVEEGREEEFISKYFPSFSDDVKLSMVNDLLKTNKELTKKATKWDNFIDSTSTYTFTDVSKLISTMATEENADLHISSVKLTQLLRDKSILSKTKGSDKVKEDGSIKRGTYKNLPNKDYEDYFNVISVSAGKFEKTQTRVKSNGVEFIYDLVKQEMIAQ